VVIDDLDFMGIAVSPDKANPPLVVDADRMLSQPSGLQRFKTIAGRDAEIVEASSVVQETQLAQRDAWMSDGSRRLRRPSQIVAVSMWRKLTIIQRL
jgi:hypothetical protein